MTRKTVLLVALTLLLSIPLVSCGKKYSAEPIEAWVIDAETKKPIEGVIVVANWELARGTVGGNVPVGQLNISETVTDKNGRFYFNEWGPIRASKGSLSNRDPQLLFFKSGYSYARRSNSFGYNSGSKRRSRWNGKKIELKKFKGSLEAYAEHLSHLDISLGFAVDYPNACEWKQIPRMIVAIHKQKKIFDEKKVYNHLFSIRRIPKKGCGSPEEFFRSYLK